MAPRLLLVDAPSGPPPQIYLPLLPPEVEVRVVAQLLGPRQAAEERLAAIHGGGLRVDVVEQEGRGRLAEIVVGTIRHPGRERLRPGIRHLGENVGRQGRCVV